MEAELAIDKLPVGGKLWGEMTTSVRTKALFEGTIKGDEPPTRDRLVEAPGATDPVRETMSLEVSLST
jgi:hypothetical protein